MDEILKLLQEIIRDFNERKTLSEENKEKLKKVYDYIKENVQKFAQGALDNPETFKTILEGYIRLHSHHQIAELARAYQSQNGREILQRLFPEFTAGNEALRADIIQHIPDSTLPGVMLQYDLLEGTVNGTNRDIFNQAHGHVLRQLSRMIRAAEWNYREENNSQNHQLAHLQNYIDELGHLIKLIKAVEPTHHMKTDNVFRHWSNPDFIIKLHQSGLKTCLLPRNVETYAQLEVYLKFQYRVEKLYEQISTEFTAEAEKALAEFTKEFLKFIQSGEFLEAAYNNSEFRESILYTIIALHRVNNHAAVLTAIREGNTSQSIHYFETSDLIQDYINGIATNKEGDLGHELKAWLLSANNDLRNGTQNAFDAFQEVNTSLSNAQNTDAAVDYIGRLLTALQDELSNRISNHNTANLDVFNAHVGFFLTFMKSLEKFASKGNSTAREAIIERFQKFQKDLKKFELVKKPLYQNAQEFTEDLQAFTRIFLQFKELFQKGETSLYRLKKEAEKLIGGFKNLTLWCELFPAHVTAENTSILETAKTTAKTSIIEFLGYCLTADNADDRTDAIKTALDFLKENLSSEEYGKISAFVAKVELARTNLAATLTEINQALDYFQTTNQALFTEEDIAFFKMIEKVAKDAKAKAKKLSMFNGTRRGYNKLEKNIAALKKEKSKLNQNTSNETSSSDGSNSGPQNSLQQNTDSGTSMEKDISNILKTVPQKFESDPQKRIKQANDLILKLYEIRRKNNLTEEQFQKLYRWVTTPGQTKNPKEIYREIVKDQITEKLKKSSKLFDVFVPGSLDKEGKLKQVTKALRQFMNVFIGMPNKHKSIKDKSKIVEVDLGKDKKDSQITIKPEKDNNLADFIFNPDVNKSNFPLEVPVQENTYSGFGQNIMVVNPQLLPQLKAMLFMNKNGQIVQLPFGQNSNHITLAKASGTNQTVFSIRPTSNTSQNVVFYNNNYSSGNGGNSEGRIIPLRPQGFANPINIGAVHASNLYLLTFVAAPRAYNNVTSIVSPSSTSTERVNGGTDLAVMGTSMYLFGKFAKKFPKAGGTIIAVTASAHAGNYIGTKWHQKYQRSGDFHVAAIDMITCQSMVDPGKNNQWEFVPDPLVEIEYLIFKAENPNPTFTQKVYWTYKRANSAHVELVENPMVKWQGISKKNNSLKEKQVQKMKEIVVLGEKILAKKDEEIAYIKKTTKLLNQSNAILNEQNKKMSDLIQQFEETKKKAEAYFKRADKIILVLKQEVKDIKDTTKKIKAETKQIEKTNIILRQTIQTSKQNRHQLLLDEYVKKYVQKGKVLPLLKTKQSVNLSSNK